MNATHDAIKQFVIQNFYVPDPDVLKDDASLVEQGIVDSTGVLELASFLQDTFAIVVEDADLVPDNMESIARMTAFVDRKRAMAA